MAIAYKPDRAQSLLHKLTLFGGTLQEDPDTWNHQLPYGHHRNLNSIGALVSLTSVVCVTKLSSCAFVLGGKWPNKRLGKVSYFSCSCRYAMQKRVKRGVYWTLVKTRTVYAIWANTKRYCVRVWWRVCVAYWPKVTSWMSKEHNGHTESCLCVVHYNKISFVWRPSDIENYKQLTYTRHKKNVNCREIDGKKGKARVMKSMS